MNKLIKTHTVLPTKTEHLVLCRHRRCLFRLIKHMYTHSIIIFQFPKYFHISIHSCTWIFSGLLRDVVTACGALSVSRICEGRFRRGFWEIFIPLNVQITSINWSLLEADALFPKASAGLISESSGLLGSLLWSRGAFMCVWVQWSFCEWGSSSLKGLSSTDAFYFQTWNLNQ